MAWPSPMQEITRHGDVVHAEMVEGVTMTANSYDVPIVTTIVGKHVRDERMPEGGAGGRDQADKVESLVAEYAEKINTYEGGRISELAGDHMGRTLVDILEKNWQEGIKDGFFRVFP
jgi:hypothetical protein